MSADQRRRRGRIVVFSPGQEEVGGASARSRLLASTLLAQGWEVHVVTRNGSLKRFRMTRSEASVVFEIPGFGYRVAGAILFYLVALPIGLLWGARASAFIGIQLFSPSTVASLCARILGRPSILLSTTSGLLGEARSLEKGRLAWIRRRIFGSATRLVVQTPQAERELATHLPPDKIVVLANPGREIAALPLTGRPNVMFSGRFSVEKDLLTLLKVWRRIRGTHPEAELTLAGSGGPVRSIEGDIRAMVQADPELGASVLLPGWVDDLGPLFARHDIYVFPSVSEGMSNALIEAVLYGRVIVASDIDANKAVLGEDYPLLFRAGDADGMEEAMLRALDDSVSRARATRWLETRARLFSPREFSRALESLIRDAVGNARN